MKEELELQVNLMFEISIRNLQKHYRYLERLANNGNAFFIANC